MNAKIPQYLPLKYEIELTARLVELVTACNTFEQLSKLAVLADFLINPAGVNHKLLFATLEYACLELRGLSSIERTVGLD
jgi:hypothetical protein